MDKTQRDGALLILLASAGYGFLPVFTKWLYGAGMQPIDVVTWRFIIAAPLMWLGALWLERKRTGSALPWKKLLLVGGLFSAAAGTAFVGLEIMSASAYLVLFYTYPAMVAVISVITGEKLSLRFWLALALTLTGVALTAPEFVAGLSENLFGAALAIGNAAVVAVYYFVSNHVMRGQTRQAQASAWVMVGALIVFLVIVFVRGASGNGGLVLPPTPDTWLWLFGLGTISTALPMFALYMGLKRLGASKAAMLSTSEAAFSLFMAALILGERMLLLPTEVAEGVWLHLQLIGTICILASVVLLQAPLPARWRQRVAQNAEDAVGVGPDAVV